MMATGYDRDNWRALQVVAVLRQTRLRHYHRGVCGG